VLDEIGPRNWLVQHDVGTRLARAARKGLVVTGEHHDPRPAVRLGQYVADDGVARDVRQAQVGQDDIELLALGHLRGFCAGGGGDDFGALRCQQHRENVPDIFSVFDQQYARGLQPSVRRVLHAGIISKTDARSRRIVTAAALTLSSEDGLLSRPWTHP
jgi:hypothetical protein